MGLIMTAVSLANLDKVFGADVAGDTAETRAKNSRREFVRGQTMLAEASPEAMDIVWRRLRRFTTMVSTSS
jgi:hypothetical protein